MQKFSASPWIIWLSSWQYLSGINNLGWQLPWLSEGGGMLVQWYINTWVYKLFKSQFLIRTDISVTQLHTLSPTEPPFLSCMFLHMCRGSVAYPVSWGMSHLCLLAARLHMKPATFFKRLWMDCKFGLLLTNWPSEDFFPFSEGCRGWPLRWRG